MNTNSITISNLETGELFNTKHKIPNDKFAIKGAKMYTNGVELLINSLSKKEMIQAIAIYNSDYIGYNNVLSDVFKFVSPDMTVVERSKFKKKLIDSNIILIYRAKIMLNPFIFIPKGDRNIKNSVYLTQRVWKYLSEDITAANDDILNHTKHIFK